MNLGRKWGDLLQVEAEICSERGRTGSFEACLVRGYRENTLLRDKGIVYQFEAASRYGVPAQAFLRFVT